MSDNFANRISGPDRLRHVVVHPRIQVFFLRAVHRMGSERNDRNVAFGRGQRTDLLRRLHAVQLGHLHVHEHDVVVHAAHGIHGLTAIFHGFDIVPLLSQKKRGELLIDLVLSSARRISNGGSGASGTAGWLVGDGASRRTMDPSAAAL